METLRLYSAPLSMFGMKVHIAALEKSLPIEVIQVPYSAERGYTPKHPDVSRVNPKGQVPVLSHEDVEIFDSTQIFEYLEDLAPLPALWPTDRKDRARPRSLEHQSDEVFFPHINRLMGLQQDLIGDAASAAIAAARAYYVRRERLLGENVFLSGSYSFADIAFLMAQVFAERLGAPMTEATPKLLGWRAVMMNRSAVAGVLRPFAEYLAANNRPVPAFLSALPG